MQEILPLISSQFLLDCENVNAMTSTTGRVHFYLCKGLEPRFSHEKLTMRPTREQSTGILHN